MQGRGYGYAFRMRNWTPDTHYAVLTSAPELAPSTELVYSDLISSHVIAIMKRRVTEVMPEWPK